MPVLCLSVLSVICFGLRKSFLSDSEVAVVIVESLLFFAVHYRFLTLRVICSVLLISASVWMFWIAVRLRRTAIIRAFSL